MAKKVGAATIIIALIISILTLIASVALKSSTHTLDFTLQRIEQAQFRFALQALGLYGIALCMPALQQEKISPVTIEKNLTVWPLADGPFSGRLTCQIAAAECIITAHLTSCIGQSKRIECAILPDKQGWAIGKWRS